MAASRRYASSLLGVLACAALAIATSGCGGKPKAPNVVLISVDTLRPDRLGFGGNTRPTSPVLDALAREGVVFTDCYSVSGWTLPSMATILTGRYPLEHGATDFHWSIDALLPTMAGVLRRNGYSTHGFVSHVILKPDYGFADGFDTFDYSVLSTGHPHDVATAEPLTNRVLEKLDELEEPYFLWVHYFDPHFAYLPHARWRVFGNRDIDRYDQEIAHTDSHIGRLLERLRDKRQYDNTIIVFTSDHGEEFGEHGGHYHYTLYDEVLRVPLVIKAPGVEPRTDTRIVEQTDLMPTVLGLLGIDAPSAELRGQDMMAPAPAGPRPVFTERDRPPPYNQRSILLGNHKLTVIALADTSRIPMSSRGTYAPVTNVTPGIYMYDLSRDPGERENVYSDADSTARELLRQLAEHFSSTRNKAQEVLVDDELREKLRSLGYIK